MSSNRMAKVESELQQLSHRRIIVGVPLDNSFLQMIASVNETGKVITAKKEWLTIPTAAAGTRKAREIPGLFKPKGKNILAVKNGDDLTVMFYLKKQVVIPKRPFIRQATIRNRHKWAKMAREGVLGIIRGNETSDSVSKRIARVMANDIRLTMRVLYDPANAPATVERKGFNNPLIDSGKLIGSITWTFRGSE